MAKKVRTHDELVAADAGWRDLSPEEQAQYSNANNYRQRKSKSKRQQAAQSSDEKVAAEAKAKEEKAKTQQRQSRRRRERRRSQKTKEQRREQEYQAAETLATTEEQAAKSGGRVRFDTGREGPTQVWEFDQPTDADRDGLRRAIEAVGQVNLQTVTREERGGDPNVVVRRGYRRDRRRSRYPQNSPSLGYVQTGMTVRAGVPKAGAISPGLPVQLEGGASGEALATAIADFNEAQTKSDQPVSGMPTEVTEKTKDINDPSEAVDVLQSEAEKETREAPGLSGEVQGGPVTHALADAQKQMNETDAALSDAAGRVIKNTKAVPEDKTLVDPSTGKRTTNKKYRLPRGVQSTAVRAREEARKAGDVDMDAPDPDITAQQQAERVADLDAAAKETAKASEAQQKASEREDRDDVSGLGEDEARTQDARHSQQFDELLASQGEADDPADAKTYRQRGEGGLRQDRVDENALDPSAVEGPGPEQLTKAYMGADYLRVPTAGGGTAHVPSGQEAKTGTYIVSGLGAGNVAAKETKYWGAAHEHGRAAAQAAADEIAARDTGQQHDVAPVQAAGVQHRLFDLPVPKTEVDTSQSYEDRVGEPPPAKASIDINRVKSGKAGHTYDPNVTQITKNVGTPDNPKHVLASLDEHRALGNRAHPHESRVVDDTSPDFGSIQPMQGAVTAPGGGPSSPLLRESNVQRATEATTQPRSGSRQFDLAEARSPLDMPMRDRMLDINPDTGDLDPDVVQSMDPADLAKGPKSKVVRQSPGKLAPKAVLPEYTPPNAPGREPNINANESRSTSNIFTRIPESLRSQFPTPDKPVVVADVGVGEGTRPTGGRFSNPGARQAHIAQAEDVAARSQQFAGAREQQNQQQSAAATAVNARTGGKWGSAEGTGPMTIPDVEGEVDKEIKAGGPKIDTSQIGSVEDAMAVHTKMENRRAWLGKNPRANVAAAQSRAQQRRMARGR